MEETSNNEKIEKQSMPVKPAHKRGFPLGGTVILLIGVLLMLDRLGVEWADNIWFPAFLIVLGIAFIFRSRR